VITTRRALVLLALTVAVVIGAGIPANAAFTDKAAVQTTVGTVTVQPPTNVKVQTYCVTTTTVWRRIDYRDPVTGAQTMRSNELVSQDTQRSKTNQDSTVPEVTAGPGDGETTTTTTVKDTELYATATWNRSTSDRVAGYAMTAHIGAYYTFTMMQGPDVTSMSANEDADYLSTSLKLTIDTVTTYGWTASSALSKTLTC
jgi:hypothetical protein